MWMHRLFVVVVLAGATLSAASFVADSGTTATPVEAENGSSYEVGTVLEFDVPAKEGEYDLLVDGNWMSTRSASEGTVVVDTSDYPPGDATVTDADSQETIYEFELTPGETASPTPTPTPTSAPSPTPDTVAVENGSTYEVGTVLEFDVPEAEGEYDLSIDGNWMATRSASEGTVVMDTSRLDAGDAELTDADSGELVYEFELTSAEDASPSPTPTPTSAPSPTPDTVAVENGSSYEVGTVLEFDVPAAEGEYDLLIDGNWVATRAASGGTIVVDTSGFDAGAAELTDANSGELVYEFALAVSEDDATTRTPSDAATAQSNQGDTDSAAHGDAGTTGSPVTDSPSPRSTTVTEATTSSDGEPTDSPTERPDRTTTTAPGFGPVAVLAAVVALLVALRRGDH